MPALADGPKFDTLVKLFHGDQIPSTSCDAGVIATKNTGRTTLRVAGTDPRADRGTMSCR